jgi:hypothetical protein
MPLKETEQVVTHQPAISFSISLQNLSNRAGGRTSNVRHRMNRTIKLLAILSLLTASCSRKEAESADKPLAEEMPRQKDVLSLNFLRANKENYVDREVTVATFLFTHEEGPWLADNLERPLVKPMSLKITEASKIIAKDSLRFRWWFGNEENFPVLLTGVFRVGRWETIIRDHYKEHHPFIEVSQAVEISTEDPVWKTRVTKEGEQASSSNGG